ncbi:MAG: hypothetical protein M3Y09_21195 [Actinomycetota bacterium]|nr:hypothetical protein [Actinomycetota bacterium]
MRVRTAATAPAVMLFAVMILGGCGATLRGAPPTGTIPSALLREARPIGVGPRFHPPAAGPVIGRCRAGLAARQGVHVELFAADRVVVIAAGIGVRGPVRFSAGRIASARCYGALATVEPTGVVLLRPGVQLSLGDLFRAWGQPLTEARAGPFAAGRGDRVRVYISGQRRPGDPATVPLSVHAEIVVEVGPRVPPHIAYTFPPGT